MTGLLPHFLGDYPCGATPIGQLERSSKRSHPGRARRRSSGNFFDDCLRSNAPRTDLARVRRADGVGPIPPTPPRMR
jgi:hypothetical protein